MEFTAHPPILPYRPRRETLAIILHDSHTGPSLVASYPFLEVHGRTLGFLTVGYHWAIDRDGYLQSFREQHQVGSHAPGRNHDTVGICLMGGLNGDGVREDNFTQDQMVSLKALVQGIRYVHGEIPLLGHSELHRKSHCPALDMETIRRMCK